jgi:hypothetical protein
MRTSQSYIVPTLDQCERISDMAPGNQNAMLFCQGCVTEMGGGVREGHASATGYIRALIQAVYR